MCPALVCTFVHTCTVLQDNTDELLELIRPSDHLHTTTTCTAPVMPDTPPVGYTQYVHTTPPSSVLLMKSSSVKKVRLEYQNKIQAYSDFKVNVNFTPSPQPPANCVNRSGNTANTVQYDTLAGEQHEDTTDEITMSTNILNQLVGLLQQ